VTVMRQFGAIIQNIAPIRGLAKISSCQSCHRFINYK